VVAESTLRCTTSGSSQEETLQVRACHYRILISFQTWLNLRIYFRLQVNLFDEGSSTHDIYSNNCHVTSRVTNGVNNIRVVQFIDGTTMEQGRKFHIEEIR